MRALEADRQVDPTTRSTAVDAAHVAFTARPRPLTPSRQRILGVASILWCQQMQFPSVRAIAAAVGLSSPSTVISSFGRSVDIHAAIIRMEWRWVTDVWLSAPDAARPRWLAGHARDLQAIDPACLRLPGLVCSAVVGSGAVRPLPPARLLVPLHALAALASPLQPGAADAESVAASIARFGSALVREAVPA